MINKNKKIFLTGHKGLLGSAVLRKLKSEGFKKIITIENPPADASSLQYQLIKLIEKYNPDS